MRNYNRSLVAGVKPSIIVDGRRSAFDKPSGFKSPNFLSVTVSKARGLGLGALLSKA